MLFRFYCKKLSLLHGQKKAKIFTDRQDLPWTTILIINCARFENEIYNIEK